MSDGATNLYALILAGGSGTRLWPLSRRSRPKQLLAIPGPGSMLECTIARLSPLVAPERIYVLTASDQVAAVRAALPQVPPDQIVGEPEPLGTAPAAALGAALVQWRDPRGTLAILPADHVVAPVDAFQDALCAAVAVAAEGYLVTFGIRPTRPETGYGYIQLGAPIGPAARAHRVARFVEKPSAEAARAYVDDGNYVWNSGMFAWTVQVFVDAVRDLLPDLARFVDATTDALAKAGGPGGAPFRDRLAERWRDIADRTTIDYGIMERCGCAACVPATFAWSDIGSWGSLAEISKADAHGNVVVGRHVGVATTGSVIHSSAGRLVATVGVEDLVVVDTPDAVLVCRRDRAQDVKLLVDALRSLGEEDTL